MTTAMTTRQLREYKNRPFLADYGQKPKWERYFSRPKTYVGVELELETSEDERFDNYKSIPASYLPQFLWKYDGSLTNGAELVTPPMTFDYHRTIDYRKMLTELSYHCTSHKTGNCGIHIHVSRPSAQIVSRIADFYLLNHSNLLKFSRRNGWNRFCRFPDSCYCNEESLRRYDGCYWFRDYGHYAAFNIENRTTVEHRIFRGSLNPIRFLGALQLVEVIHLLAETNKLNWSNVCSTAFNKAEFCELYQNLREYNLVPAGLLPDAVEQ